MGGSNSSAAGTAKNYLRFIAVLSVNTILMFFITFAMVDQLDHIHVKLNRVYMALMMVVSMGIMMLLIMGTMYGNKKLNALLLGAFALLFVVTFAFARTQTTIGDEQFLKSMIPHHSSAILMCEESQITDQEIAVLCEQIVRSQKDEIAQMEEILVRRGHEAP